LEVLKVAHDNEEIEAHDVLVADNNEAFEAIEPGY